MKIHEYQAKQILKKLYESLTVSKNAHIRAGEIDLYLFLIETSGNEVDCRSCCLMEADFCSGLLLSSYS